MDGIVNDVSGVMTAIDDIGNSIEWLGSQISLLAPVKYVEELEMNMTLHVE